MIVSDDATIWSVTYDRHYDDCKSFIIQATEVLMKSATMFSRQCPLLAEDLRRAQLEGGEGG
jgi:hypothetical protein